MSICLAITTETSDGENRVAIVPAIAEKFSRAGVKVVLEKGAGVSSFYPDNCFDDIEFSENAADACARAQILLKVAPPSVEEVALMPEGSILICYMHPHGNDEVIRALRDRKVTALSMELVPRISRAQSMDSLSSQAAIAGYKAALMAADLSARFFPMLTTAAGTIRPSRVFVIGAGVAGLQAIATAKRLGAIVEAYDVRSATKEQVESLGGKFLDIGVDASSEGGYARELTESEKHKEREMMGNTVAAAHAVICTAHVPGRPAPRLIDTAVVERMLPGSVIIDLAAESGGNCELTQPGKTIVHNGVTIHGPLHVPGMLAVHASEMYSRNLYNLVQLMISDGELKPDWDDEILAGCTVTRDGEIKHGPTRERLEGASS